MFALAMIWCLAAPAAAPSSQPVRPPTTRPGKGLTITGTLTPPERVKSIRLIDREDPANVPNKQARTFPATFDRSTGAFMAENLPRGFYDLLIETSAGQIDGVNLRDTPRRGQVAAPSSPTEPLTEEDLTWIATYVREMKTFENKKRLLFTGGHAERAKALVELIRDEPTTLGAPEPEATWRVEIWEFQRLYGTWRRKTWQAIYRERMPIREFRRLNRMFEPALGGLPADPAFTTDLGEYVVPETFDPARGRTPD